MFPEKGASVKLRFRKALTINIKKNILYMYLYTKKGGREMLGGALWLLLFSAVALAGLVITVLYGKVFDYDDE